MPTVRLLSPVNEEMAMFELYKTAYAMTTCTMNEEKLIPDDIAKHRRLIQQLIDNNHTSVLEHINYTFEFSNITRALLQEISRHRHTSPTVQSTRWALKKMETQNVENIIYIPEELSQEDRQKYLESVKNMLELRAEFSKKYPNDVAKYLTPECVYTKEVITINARSLINMIELRTAPRALKEFRELMNNIFLVIPESHKFIFFKAYEKNMVFAD